MNGAPTPGDSEIPGGDYSGDVGFTTQFLEDGPAPPLKGDSPGAEPVPASLPSESPSPSASGRCNVQGLARPTGCHAWAHHRGGSADGVANTEWSGLGPDGEALYVSGWDNAEVFGEPDSEYLAYKLDADSGNRLWSFSWDGPGNDTDIVVDGAVGPAGKTVYLTGLATVTSEDRWAVTFALDAATGAVQWKKTINASPTYDSGHGVDVGPEGKRVLVSVWSEEEGAEPNDIVMVGLDADSGAEAWRTRIGKEGRNEAPGTESLAIGPDGDKAYLTDLTQDRFIAVNTSNGDVLWDRGLQGAKVALSVAPDGDTVFGVGLGGTVRAVDTADGTLLWEADPPAGHFSDVAVSPDGGTAYAAGYEDMLFFPRAVVGAFEVETGDPAWFYRYDRPESASSRAMSLAVGPESGTVYVGGSSLTATGDDFLLVALNGSNGSEAWSARYNAGGAERVDWKSGVHVGPDEEWVFASGLLEGFPEVEFPEATREIVTVGYEMEDVRGSTPSLVEYGSGASDLVRGRLSE